MYNSSSFRVDTINSRAVIFNHEDDDEDEDADNSLSSRRWCASAAILRTMLRASSILDGNTFLTWVLSGNTNVK